MKYDNGHDANLYLRDTLVKLEGKPVSVLGVNGDMMAEVLKEDGSYGIVHVDSLDLTPIQLGYVYSKQAERVYYLERRPQRQWRQGLSSGVCRDKISRSGVSLSANSELTKRLFKGRFPKVHRAYKVACSMRNEIPFHPMFTIDFGGTIRYKTFTVGSWCTKERTIKLMDNFSYLEDTVEEYMDENYRHM